MKLAKISITGKHFIVYLAVCVFTIAAVAVYSYYSARSAILERTFEQLTSVRVEKSNSVERFLNDRIRDMEMVAASDAVAELYRTNEESFMAGKAHLRDSIFATYLDSYLRTSGYYKKIILVTEDGSVEFSNLNEPDDKFIALLPGDSALLTPVKDLIKRIESSGKACFNDFVFDKDSNATMFVGAPVFDQINKRLLGSVMLEIAVESINEMMYEDDPQNGLGYSGEAYIVGKDYKIRTASRFQDHSVFNTTVETEGVRRALKGQTGVEIINDYRGVTVLSAFSKIQIPELDWVIMAEIDKDEAMVPVVNLRNDIIWLACIITLLLSGIVYLISRKMTMPIVKLRQATARITEGDYNFHLVATTQDELGVLTEAFNQMADQLEIQSEQIRDARLKRLSSMIDGQEIERQRLSRDLHDSLGQSILAVKLKLEQARQDDIEKSRKCLAEALTLIKDVIQEIRSITNDLMPPVLIAFGVEKGLDNLCREASSGTGTNISVECHNIPETLSERTQVYLYRIAQEAVHNISKHSGATEAMLKLSGDGAFLNLHIKDNGVGFDIGDTGIRANGINNILERTELLGGICTFTSAKGEGTTIDVKIPTG